MKNLIFMKNIKINNVYSKVRHAGNVEWQAVYRLCKKILCVLEIFHVQQKLKLIFNKTY